MRAFGLIAATALLVSSAAPSFAQQSAQGNPPAATAAADTSQFVSSLANRAIAELTTGDLSQTERVKRFRTLLTDAFDIPLIGRFVLGRYWRTASETERAEYLKVFEDFIVQTYAQRFTDFRDAQVNVTQTKTSQDGDVTATVDVGVNGKQPTRLDIRLRREASTFKIFDVVVEGVSMSVTQRDDFAAVIQRNGGKVEGLIASLRDKIQSASAQ